MRGGGFQSGAEAPHSKELPIDTEATPTEHPHLNPPPEGEEVVGPQGVSVNRYLERGRKLLEGRGLALNPEFQILPAHRAV